MHEQTERVAELQPKPGSRWVHSTGEVPGVRYGRQLWVKTEPFTVVDLVLPLDVSRRTRPHETTPVAPG